MKIKLEDLTIKECSDICNSKENCSECPLWDKIYDHCMFNHNFFGTKQSILRFFDKFKVEFDEE